MLGAILMITRVALCGIMVVYRSVGLIVTGVAHNEVYGFFDRETVKLVILRDSFLV